MMNHLLSTRGPSDDWDPQGYSDEDKVEKDLAELGMHTLEDKEKEKEEEEIAIAIEAPDDAPLVVEEEVDEDEDVDELTELDRVAKALKNDDIVMPFNDEE